MEVGLKQIGGREERSEKLERRGLMVVMTSVGELDEGRKVEGSWEDGVWQSRFLLVMIPKHGLLTGEGRSSFSTRRRYFIF